MLKDLELKTQCGQCQGTVSLAINNCKQGFYLGTTCMCCNTEGVINTVNSRFFPDRCEAIDARTKLLRGDISILNSDQANVKLHTAWIFKIMDAINNNSDDIEEGGTWQKVFQSYLADKKLTKAATLMRDIIIQDRDSRHEVQIFLLRKCLQFSALSGVAQILREYESQEHESQE